MSYDPSLTARLLGDVSAFEQGIKIRRCTQGDQEQEYKVRSMFHKTLISSITQTVSFPSCLHICIFSQASDIFVGIRILMDIITTENLGDESLKGMSTSFLVLSSV
jgi:hypothetical protein